MTRAQCWLAGMLAAALSLALTVPAFAAGDTVSRGEARDILVAVAGDYNPDVKAEDVLRGSNGGALETDRAVTRAEALVMLSRAFGELPEPKGDNALWGMPETFPDVPNWAKSELENVLQAGITMGDGNGEFVPGGAISSQELDLLIRRVYAMEGSNLKDDFYAAVNKEWLETAEFPPGYPYSGTLYQLTYDVTEQVSELIREIAASDPKAGSAQEKIKNLYGNIMNWDARNAAGITPLKPYLEAIDSAKSLEELMQVHHHISQELTASLLVGFGTTVDVRDSSRHILAFAGPSPTLSKDDYASGGAVVEAYLEYLRTILQLGGESESDAAAHAAAFYDMEKTLAAAMMELQEYGDVSKTNNLYTLEKLKVLLPGMDLDGVLEASGFPAGGEIVVADVGLLEAAAPYLTEEHIDLLKTCMRLGLLSAFGNALNHEFIDAANAFQSARYGADISLPDEETAAQMVQSLLADYLSEAYVERYFSAEAKADVENMVDEFLAIYKERIQALDWMSTATKTKALEKLDAMAVNVGYPDKWETYLDQAEIKSATEGGTYFDNLLSITHAAREDSVAEFQKPVDKTEWMMPAYTVNAYYNPTANSINFPAGILQAPLYDVDADPTDNLGGIGYVIAHEITHAFDNNGAKYDSEGNAADWWTDGDYAAFEKLCAQAVEFYDGLEAIPGISCNGTLTLSENIADLGAIACVTQAESREETPDYASLYRAAARTWRFTATREIHTVLSQSDIHVPGKLRGSRVLQSRDEFFTAFDIQPGDGMWLEPEQRVSIW